MKIINLLIIGWLNNFVIVQLIQMDTIRSRKTFKFHCNYNTNCLTIIYIMNVTNSGYCIMYRKIFHEAELIYSLESDIYVKVFNQKELSIRLLNGKFKFL